MNRVEELLDHVAATIHAFGLRTDFAETGLTRWQAARVQEIYEEAWNAPQHPDDWTWDRVATWGNQLQAPDTEPTFTDVLVELTWALAARAYRQGYDDARIVCRGGRSA